MRRPSWLDAMLERFQHSWETNPQFRAIWSGGAGLVIIVGLCAVLGVSATFANAIGGSFGGSGGDNSSFITQQRPQFAADRHRLPDDDPHPLAGADPPRRGAHPRLADP